MHADDNQLFVSSVTSEFSAEIANLQATVDLVSQRMSSNLLSLNQSKTEFLLIGLPAQLLKISNPSHLMPSNAIITPTSSARNLGVIFDSTLSISDHISSVSESCFLSIRDLRRIRNTLDQTTAHTIATSLIHSKLDYCNSLFLNLPSLNLIVFSSFSTLSLEQYLSHQNSATSILFCSLFTGSKINSVLNIKSIYLSPTKLFSLVNLLISIAFSLFNPTVLLAPLISLPCNVHQFAHVSK
jgi:hypothetical protein